MDFFKLVGGVVPGILSRALLPSRSVCKDEEDALSKLGEDEGGYYGAIYKFTAIVPAAGPRNFKIEIPEKTEEGAIELKAEKMKAA